MTLNLAHARRVAAVALLGLIAGAPFACTLTTSGIHYEDATGSASGGAAQAGGAGPASSNAAATGAGGAGHGGEGGATTSSSASAGGAGGSGGSCPTGKGPDMVKVTSTGPQGAVDFCIDVTEVTAAQYWAWLQTSPDPADQPSVCKPWNMTHMPNTNVLKCQSYNVVAEATTTPNRPVACINWCDASMFCKWAGKRLCGAIGGGPNTYKNTGATKTGEWYMVCSAGDTLKYPYGDTYDGSLCNGADYDGDAPIDVGSLATCVTGDPVVYDMSGNVSEWEDACDGDIGPNDSCQNRNAGFAHGSTQLRCEDAFRDSRSGAFRDGGIRCCADPK